jgi:hypothetical protein
MKYWKIVDGGQYHLYGLKLLKLFYQEKKYFRSVNSFWNEVNSESMEEVYQIVPEFQSVIDIFGPMRQMALLFIHPDLPSTLHTDHTVDLNFNVQARLNVPVFNCEGSSTAFYELPKEIYDAFFVNDGGTKTWPFEYRTSITPVTQVELIQPTILRTSAPHTVFCGQKSPRISLTMSFQEDVVKYLED